MEQKDILLIAYNKWMEHCAAASNTKKPTVPLPSSDDLSY